MFQMLRCVLVFIGLGLLNSDLHPSETDLEKKTIDADAIRAEYGAEDADI